MLSQLRIGQGYDVHALRNQHAKKRVGLRLARYLDVIFKFFLPLNGRAACRDDIGNILFHLQRKVYAAVFLFDFVQIALQHGAAAVQNGDIGAEFLHRGHLVAGHDKIFSLLDLLIDD